MATATPVQATTTSPAQSFIRFAFWPLIVTSVLATAVWADGADQQSAARGGLAIGTLLFVMLIEQLVPRPGRGGIVGDPQLRQDLGLFFTVTLTEVFTNLALVATALWLGAQLQGVLGTSLWPSQWSWPAQAVLAFLAVDFLDYWVHRASHRVPWLWSIHVHHHDIGRLHVFKGTRNHPLAGLTRVFGAYFPLLLLGAPAELLFGYQVYITSIGSVSHANLDMRFPVFLNRLFSTPAVHRVHHASALELNDRNFAAGTTLWDQLFGTYQAPEAYPDPDIGVGEASVPGGESILRRLAWPFIWWRYTD